MLRQLRKQDLGENRAAVRETDLRLLAAAVILRNCRGGKVSPSRFNGAHEHLAGNQKLQPKEQLMEFLQLCLSESC